MLTFSLPNQLLEYVYIKIEPSDSKCFRRKSGKSLRLEVNVYCLFLVLEGLNNCCLFLISIGKERRVNLVTYIFIIRFHLLKSVRISIRPILICSVRRLSSASIRRLTILSNIGIFTISSQTKESFRNKPTQWLLCARQVCFNLVNLVLCSKDGVMIHETVSL